MVTLAESILTRYPAVSLDDSPYPAHTEGRAVDLNPGDGSAPSPVSGKVLATETVRAPTRPGTAEPGRVKAAAGGPKRAVRRSLRGVA